MGNSLPDLFKVLSDDTRLKILCLLVQEQELCVCEFMSALNDSQPKISRHLALLKKQQIVVDRKHKQWVFYSIHPSLPDWFRVVLEHTYQSNLDYISESSQALRAMGDRPIRQEVCC
ncbi:metalloregulator ArsR/SmtB family transcription factor [Thalassotalea fusca]